MWAILLLFFLHVCEFANLFFFFPFLGYRGDASRGPVLGLRGPDPDSEDSGVFGRVA